MSVAEPDAELLAASRALAWIGGGCVPRIARMSFEVGDFRVLAVPAGTASYDLTVTNRDGEELRLNYCPINWRFEPKELVGRLGLWRLTGAIQRVIDASEHGLGPLAWRWISSVADGSEFFLDPRRGVLNQDLEDCNLDPLWVEAELAGAVESLLAAKAAAGVVAAASAARFRVYLRDLVQAVREGASESAGLASYRRLGDLARDLAFEAASPKGRRTPTPCADPVPGGPQEPRHGTVDWILLDALRAAEGQYVSESDLAEALEIHGKKPSGVRPGIGSLKGKGHKRFIATAPRGHRTGGWAYIAADVGP